MIKTKKAQHEIVGFVLIILIVTIIGLVFLTFSLSKETSLQNTIEISNLLESSMYYTTGCAVNYIPQYRDMQDLIKECYKDISGDFVDCLDGRKVCDALESEFKQVISSSLMVHEDSPNKAYKSIIFFDPLGDSPNEEILSFGEGNFKECSSILGGNHLIAISTFGSGTITVELEVCKG